MEAKPDFVYTVTEAFIRYDHRLDPSANPDLRQHLIDFDEEYFGNGKGLAVARFQEFSETFGTDLINVALISGNPDSFLNMHVVPLYLRRRAAAVVSAQLYKADFRITRASLADPFVFAHYQTAKGEYDSLARLRSDLRARNFVQTN